MDILIFLENLRSNYLQEFETVYHQKLEVNEQVFPEIAFEISKGLYKNLFVVDLIGKNGDANFAIEVGARDSAYSEEINTRYGDLLINFGSVAWDSMKFSFQPVFMEMVGFEDWFDKWIDLEGARRVDGEITSNIIHSAILGGAYAEVDFGSSSANAVIELFDIFIINKIKKVAVTNVRK